MQTELDPSRLVCIALPSTVFIILLGGAMSWPLATRADWECNTVLGRSYSPDLNPIEKFFSKLKSVLTQGGRTIIAERAGVRDGTALIGGEVSGERIVQSHSRDEMIVDGERPEALDQQVASIISLTASVWRDY